MGIKFWTLSDFLWSGISFAVLIVVLVAMIKCANAAGRANKRNELVDAHDFHCLSFMFGVLMVIAAMVFVPSFGNSMVASTTAQWLEDNGFIVNRVDHYFNGLTIAHVDGSCNTQVGVALFTDGVTRAYDRATYLEVRPRPQQECPAITGLEHSATPFYTFVVVFVVALSCFVWVRRYRQTKK